jgi:hypothetical protein
MPVKPEQLAEADRLAVCKGITQFPAFQNQRWDAFVEGEYGYLACLQGTIRLGHIEAVKSFYVEDIQIGLRHKPETVMCIRFKVLHPGWEECAIPVVASKA